MQPIVYQTRIRESHLDTFGHVNNAKYLELYEEARWELLFANGISLHDIQREQIGPVVLDVALTFKKGVRLNFCV